MRARRAPARAGLTRPGRDTLTAPGALPVLPPDHGPCPRCGGCGHVPVSRPLHICRDIWWDITATERIPHTCGRTIDPWDWRGRGLRRCREHEVQAQRLAELGISVPGTAAP